jgi:altronate dehydratase
MEALAAETFDLVVATASGHRSRGEQAGHSQVSLWRDWRQTDTTQLARLAARPAPAGQPLPLAAPRKPGGVDLPRVNLVPTTDGRPATERLGLVLPTSLCASQIARLAAERLNAKLVEATSDANGGGVTRFVALPHSEGCGFAGASMHERLHRTYLGYLTHPNVAAALLLEHGCEKVTNDAMRHEMQRAALDPGRFGWASVQLDGGVERACERVGAWFETALARRAPAPRRRGSVGSLTLGVLSAASLPPVAAEALAQVVRAVVMAGGSVLIPEGDRLLAEGPFMVPLLGAIATPTGPAATLLSAEVVRHAGLHVVATETDHWVENVTALGGGGAHLCLGFVDAMPEQGHPLMPVLQIAMAAADLAFGADEVDAFLPPDAGAADLRERLTTLLAATAAGEYVPAATRHGFIDFQLTRGLLGVSA